MFFVLENEFADGELWRLRELLDLLDQRLAEIGLLIQESQDPDSDGLCDRGEYLIGVGFVAIQQYLVETIMFTGLDKGEGYDLGPVHPSGETCIRLINSCANWWKHEPEWYNHKKVPKSGERTHEHITNAVESPSYQLSNVLASFCKTNEVSLVSVIPYLEEWRAEVHDGRRQGVKDTGSTLDT